MKAKIPEKLWKALGGAAFGAFQPHPTVKP
jgi:hypothetical protein